MLFRSLTTTLLNGGWAPRVSRGWHNKATQPRAPTQEKTSNYPTENIRENNWGGKVVVWGGGGEEEEKTWLKITLSKHHLKKLLTLYERHITHELSSIKHLSIAYTNQLLTSSTEGFCLNVFNMNPSELFLLEALFLLPSFDIWWWQVNLPVKPSRPQQSWIKYIRSVCT